MATFGGPCIYGDCLFKKLSFSEAIVKANYL